MPSIGRLVKESIARELVDELTQRPNVLVTTIHRLPAVEADGLRRQLHVSKAKLVVVKRRLGRRTAEQLKLAGLPELLDGSVGLILTADDVLPAAKLLIDFHKAHEDQLAVRGGLIDGQVLDKSRIEQLANLPPKPQLLAQVVFTIESPIAELIGVIEQLVGQIAWLAEQAAAKKPQAPNSPTPSEPATAA